MFPLVPLCSFGGDDWLRNVDLHDHIKKDNEIDNIKKKKNRDRKKNKKVNFSQKDDIFVFAVSKRTRQFNDLGQKISPYRPQI